MKNHKPLPSSELRLGNIVNLCFEHKPGWFPAKVTAIHSDGTISTDTTHNIEGQTYFFEGVRLSDEKFLELGFEKGISNDIYNRTIYSIQVANQTSLYFDVHKDWMRGNQDVEWYLSHEWNNNHFKNDFWGCPEYVHQLQNLYHALTNEELPYEKN